MVLIQHQKYLSSEYGNDCHSHPLHVLIFVVAKPLHDQFGSFKPLNSKRKQSILNSTFTENVQNYELTFGMFIVKIVDNL